MSLPCYLQVNNTTQLLELDDCQTPEVLWCQWCQILMNVENDACMKSHEECTSLSNTIRGISDLSCQYLRGYWT